MGNIASALILAVGITAGGFLLGGRFELVATEGGSLARIDRYSGEVAKCIPGTEDPCGWMLSGGPSRSVTQRSS
jgi:hypothetical protein